MEHERNASADHVRPERPSPDQAGVKPISLSDIVRSGDVPTKVCPSCHAEFDGHVRFCPVDGSVLHAKEQTDNLIGEIIAERYHILKKIGQGGMGSVYLAEHVRMGRRCAIKVMNQSLSQDAGAVSRFTREAANASRISNDHVAHIYDFGESKEHGIYLAMEYLEGEPLASLIARSAPVAEKSALDIAIQITDALSAAHGEGVVHRDLTPNNIIVGRDHEGRALIKVVDFGIAKTLQEPGGSLTRTGFVVGTPQYMSPEQLIAERVDGRSDIYSLGIILFELLTGSQPFSGIDSAYAITRRLTEAPPKPSTMRPGLRGDMDALVLTCLARMPAERFADAEQLRSALEDALDAALTTDANNEARNAALDAVIEATPRRLDRRAARTGPRQVRRSLELEAQPDPAPSQSEARKRISVSWRAAASALLSRLHPMRALRLLPRLRGALVVAASIVGLATIALLLRPDEVSNDMPAALPPLSAPPAATSAGSSAIIAPEPPVPAVEPPARLRFRILLPRDAVVLIDRAAARVSGNVLSLSAGTHDLEIRAAGYEPLQRHLTVEAGHELLWTEGLRALPEPAAVEKPTVAASSPDIATKPQTRGFQESVEREIDVFRRALELRNIDAIRGRISADFAGELETLLASSASTIAIKVGVRFVTPDSAGARATFALRIDEIGGRNLLPFTEFEASFTQVSTGWRLITVDRQ